MRTDDEKDEEADGEPVRKPKPAILQLLQTALDLRTDDTDVLAEKLCRSRDTIRTEWRRACQVLRVHRRWEAVMAGLDYGWIVLHPR